MFYEFFLKVFVSLVYYVKIPNDSQSISDFIDSNVKTSIKFHLAKSTRLVYDDDIYVFHISGLFKDEKEIEFAKKVMAKNSWYKSILFWIWYYSLQLFLDQSNIITTLIYVKETEIYDLVCISVEYRARKVHYVLSMFVNTDVKDLYSFKYMDILLNSFESGCKILCLGYKTDLFKIGLGGKRLNSHLSLVDELDRYITFTDLVLRFLCIN